MRTPAHKSRVGAALTAGVVLAAGLPFVAATSAQAVVRTP